MDALKINKGSPTTASSASPSSSANNASSSNANKSAASAASSNANSSTVSTNTSITVRFNASDECIDDLFQSFHHNSGASGVGGGGSGGGGGGGVGGGGSNTNLAVGGGVGGGDSLSTSPSQHQQMPLNNPDEVNTRNNFLQGNFFNRKSGLPVKQQLSPIHPCPPNQLDHGSLGGVCGGPHSSSSPIPPGIVGGGSPYNGSQAGGSSGGVSPNLIAGISPNSNAGISPNKYRRSISFPIKGANSPTPQGYGLDINAAKAAGMPTLSVGNGSMSAGASGCGDAPLFMGAGGQPYMTNGMDMRPLDHCLNDIMRGMGAVGPGGDNNVTAATIMAERMRNHKLSERHLGEIDAVAIAANNGASVYLDPTMKLNSPSRSSPHSQGSDHTARFSRKVFVGGLPPDIDEDEITSSFRRFGPLVVDWPHKAESKSYFPPKGYAFLLFQDENSVQQLIDSCITDDDKLYLCVSSPTIKDKPVQIRPWRLADADYVLDATMSLDPRKTVFVGGVPRPLKAYELAMIMNRLYGGVCYAGIDTDPELKYPKGAGRVAFSNQQSYIAAISARSGSIEGISPTSVGPNLIAALSSNDASSMGTWKMIKGKVSQTIEDIKASKSNSHTTMTPPVYPTVVIKGGHQTPVIDFDSDLETKTSVSEDLSVEHDRRSSAGSTKHKRASKLEDSDTDFENEILLEGDVEHSRLRRGLANLKSKVKAKHEAHQAKKATLSTAVGPTAIRGSMKKDISPSRSTGSSSSSTSLRGTFLRRRRQKGVEQGDLISPTNISPISALAATVVSGELAATVPVVVSGKPAKKSVKDHKKDIEIESGVEMLEDMIPPSNLSLTDDSGTSVTYYVSKRNVLDLPLTDLTGSSSSDIKVLYTNPSMNIPNITPYQSLMSITSMRIKDNAARAEIRNTVLKIFESVKNLPILSLLALMLILVLPINDFIRGVLCCLLGITIVESIWNFIQSMIEYYILTAKPEKKVFNIPDYTKMEICEVPAVEEFKTLKSYDGWMNEVDSYDPNTFHISMTRSVYVKLEGSILHISNTHARIPKRLMWNEPPIDLKTIAFTCHRSYNLLGCRIELLPIGLAKKRHFNRKYPIQLIVKPMKSKKTTDGSKSNTPKMAAKHHKSGFHKSKQEKHDTKETSDIKSTAYESTKAEAEIDFGATIMNADLQKLQDDVNPDGDLGNITVPCGDEVRILLFTRGAREKEDWYRRFIAASIGDVRDKDLQLNNVKLIDDTGLQAAATKYAQQLTNPKPKDNSQTTMKSTSTVLEHQSTTEEILDIPSQKDDIEHDFDMLDAPPDETDSIEGLLMTAGAARNDPEYVKFMALYQNSCRQTRIPVYKGDLLYNPNDTKRHKRTLRQENELWRGIDQSLFLGPSGSVVWANVLVGRVLFSSLQNANLLEKLQDILQKKLNSIKLPSFMEDVIIKSIDLGNKPPLVHRVSQPLLDERGIWYDMDVTYEGLCQITVTTKLNLLRLKRPTRQSYMQDSTFNIAAAQMNASQYSTLLHAEMSPSSSVSAYTGSLTAIAGCGPIGATVDDDVGSMEDPPFSSIFDSDAESTGSSSTESDNSLTGTLNENPNCVNESSNPGNARRIFKFVDRIATSNFFQYATELSYVQKAMENMSTTITLGIDLHGLVSRVTLNLPPPPSDRVWLAFRAPPRLWITARPTVGDKSVDWSIVTNVIEGKLCEAVNKYLVFPNMVDLTIPILGKQQSASE